MKPCILAALSFALAACASSRVDAPPWGKHALAAAEAYLRIAGQQCLYNLWSRLGRDHLELLLDELRLVR
ncbi:MAG TPA: hypothetical protein VIL97_06930 [Thermoanaerobaculia bacterium]